MKHGQVRMAKAGCDCHPCTATLARRRREGKRAAIEKELGNPRYVDADPVRAHVRMLLESGMNATQIAYGAGLGTGSQMIVYNLLHGLRSRQQPPARRVMRKTAAALLAVQPHPGAIVAGASTDATGTQRRLQALLADGWTYSYLAGRLGTSSGNLSKLLHQSRVLSSTAARIAALYDEISGAPGPSTRANLINRRKGWLTPGWWDADTIDDPTYAPPTEVRTENGALLFDWAYPHAPQHWRLASKGYSVTYIAELSTTARRYVRRDILEQRAA